MLDYEARDESLTISGKIHKLFFSIRFWILSYNHLQKDITGRISKAIGAFSAYVQNVELVLQRIRTAIHHFKQSIRK